MPPIVWISLHVAFLLSFTSALPLARPSEGLQIAWTFSSGAEISSSGALSTDGKTQLAETGGIWSVSAIPHLTSQSFAISTDAGLFLCSYSSDSPYDCQVAMATPSSALDPKVPLMFGPDGTTIYAALSHGAAVALFCVFPSAFCSSQFVFEAGGPMISTMALGADGTLYGNAQGFLFAACTTGPIAGKSTWQAHFYQQASTGVTLSNATLIAGT